MKKALSALLALALLLGSCSAFADTVSWSTGSGFKGDPSSFKTYFGVFSNATGYTFNWSSSTKSESGYTVHTAKSSDSIFTLKMYAKNNKVHMVYGEAAQGSAGAKDMGSWLGAAVLTSAYCLYFGDHNDLPEKVINGSMDDLNDLITKFSSVVSYSESQLRNGVVLKGKMCGYPYALEIRVSGSTAATLKFHIKLYIVPNSGKLTVQ